VCYHLALEFLLTTPFPQTVWRKCQPQCTWLIVWAFLLLLQTWAKHIPGIHHHHRPQLLPVRTTATAQDDVPTTQLQGWGMGHRALSQIITHWCCRASRIVGRNTHQGSTAGRRTIQAYPPTYPHEDYFSYLVAAFILSYRLLSKVKPVEDGFWERVMTESGIIFVDDVVKLSVDLQTLLEVNTKHYLPPPVSSTDPAFKFYYSGDLHVPPE
jgi:hypothetical protein